MPADVAALAMLGWHRLLICPAQSFIHSFHLTIHSFDKSSLGLYSAGCRSQHWEHKTDLSSHPELPRCEEATCRGGDWTGVLRHPPRCLAPSRCSEKSQRQKENQAWLPLRGSCQERLCAG